MNKIDNTKLMKGGENMGKKKTHEEYVAEVAEKNPDIEVVGKYVGAHINIVHKCKRCGYEWNPKPSNVLRGKGCPKCFGNAKVTYTEYISEVVKINPNIEVLGEYINSITPILHKCKIDLYEWMAIPNNILRGSGCPKCAGNIKRTCNGYIKEVAVKNPNIEVVGMYIDARVPITHRCKIDGYLWEASPYSILGGCGCPKCGGTLIKTTENYCEELKKINPDVEVIEEYINARTPILHKCKIDGCEWKISPSNALQGKGCPACRESNGERKIRQWMETNNINYIYQKSFDNCRDKKVLPFDFYLIDMNILIEYDGEGHFEPIKFNGISDEEANKKFVTTQYHDSIKTKYCQEHNIQLLRIPYFKDVETELNNFIHLI